MPHVILYDLADPKRRLRVAVNVWRASLQLFFNAELLSRERLDRLTWRLGGAGTSLTEVECQRVGEFLVDEVLPRGEDLEVFNLHGFESDDESLGRESGVFGLLTKDWLLTLASFMFEVRGVGAIDETFFDDRCSPSDRAMGPRGRPTRS